MDTEKSKYKVVYKRPVGNGTGYWQYRTEYYSDLFLAKRKLNHVTAGKLYERSLQEESTWQLKYSKTLQKS